MKDAFESGNTGCGTLHSLRPSALLPARGTRRTAILVWPRQAHACHALAISSVRPANMTIVRPSLTLMLPHQQSMVGYARPNAGTTG